jgi:hypothetical protein
MRKIIVLLVAFIFLGSGMSELVIQEDREAEVFLNPEIYYTDFFTKLFLSRDYPSLFNGVKWDSKLVALGTPLEEDFDSFMIEGYGEPTETVWNRNTKAIVLIRDSDGEQNLKASIYELIQKGVFRKDGLTAAGLDIEDLKAAWKTYNKE